MDTQREMDRVQIRTVVALYIAPGLKEDLGESEGDKADKDETRDISGDAHEEHRDSTGCEKEKAPLDELRLLLSHVKLCSVPMQGGKAKRG